MARILKVCFVLLTCGVLSKPSFAFPSCRNYDSHCYYDDCGECGYIAYPDEPLRSIQVIQGGSTCHRCQPLSYQVQVPVPPPSVSCGQQFGFQVEVPHQVACKPCLNVGYEIEMPITPCTPKLPNLPVSVTVPAPHYDCHQPCHMSYEMETPVTPCTPLLTNLNTQVDRVVLPCPCSPPIVEGYVPESEPSSRRKRFVDWQDCDFDDYDDEDEDENENDSLEERPSRSRRSPANWRPRSTSRSRSEFFPASRTDESPRSEWMVDDFGDNDGMQNQRSRRTRNHRIVSRGFDDDFNDFVFGDRSSDQDDDGRIVTPDTMGGGRVMRDLNNWDDDERIVSGGLGGRNDDGRIVSRDLGGRNDDGRIVSRDLGGRNDDGRIVSRDLGGRNDDGRIVSRGLGVRNDDGRIVSRGLVDDLQWRPEVSSDPVEKRREDPVFFIRHDPYLSVEDRMLIDGLLSSGPGGSEQNGVVNAQLGTSGGTGGPTVVDNILGSVRSRNTPDGRCPSNRNGGRLQDCDDRGDREAPPGRTRLNGSSGTHRRSSIQSDSQKRITTPSTNRSGDRQRTRESSGSESQLDAEGEGSRQRMVSSNTMIGSQRSSGTQSNRNKPQSQLRGSDSHSEGSSQQGRVESESPNGSQQRVGGSKKRGGSQQRQPGRQSQNRQQEPQRVGGSQRDSEEEPQSGWSQDTTGSSANQRSRSQTNPQQRSPSSNSDTRRRSGQSKRVWENDLQNGGMSASEDLIRLYDYLDYPDQLNFPGMNGLPPIKKSSTRRMTNSVEPNHSWSSQTFPSAMNQNLNAVDYALLSPSPVDTSRIVTPTTFDQQPPFADYDFEY